jgi:2-methylisocitrate lyase-like PEP mutase family enzyme
MATQGEKVARFRALHASSIFVIANAWDAGSARVLVGLGFEAIATSSGAMANVLGRLDGNVEREEALAHARAIVDAVDVPVSADLEKGFGDTPEDAAETIRRASLVGLAGGSIEDFSGDESKPIYGVAQAAERVAAAAQAARGAKNGFVLTARTENHLHGKASLDDTILRLQAYEKAGADVLFAPGLPDLAAVRAVCAAVTKPVNFMVGIPGKSWSIAELQAAGVRRVSVASSLYKAAMTGLVAAAREIREKGTFGYVERNLPSSDLSRFMRR